MRPIAGAALVNDCMYNGTHEDEDATLEVREGGRAKFDRNIRDLRGGLKPVKGVGDAAYMFAFPGSPAAGVEYWVVTHGVYFDFKLYTANPNRIRWATDLAAKIAGRIR